MNQFFPDPSMDFEQGLVAVGGELSTELLVEAYGLGIFPWPQEGYPMLWFCPDRRGILKFSEFEIPTRLERDLKKYAHLKVTRNQSFSEVIHECAKQKREGQKGTWITQEMCENYIVLNQKGWAHSWEVWEGSELVGGGYGVLVKNVFSGESLFHKKTNMSKVALIHMVRDLQSEGHDWMDTQMVTPLLESFGAREISKKQYLEWLKKRHLSSLK